MYGLHKRHRQFFGAPGNEDGYFPTADTVFLGQDTRLEDWTSSLQLVHEVIHHIQCIGTLPKIEVFPKRGAVLSTFELTEALMPKSPDTKRPFQRICEVIVKNGAESAVIQHRIQRRAWFPIGYG